MPDPNVALLVVSCDRYADLWTPFFTLLERRWRDCPFAVHLGTNHRRFEHPRVATVAIGDDRAWSANLRAMVRAIGAPYVLLMLEDFFLRGDVDTAGVLACAEHLARGGGGLVRLLPNPGPDEAPADGTIGAISRAASYRISTQASIWHVDFLERMLVDRESAWEFELNGTERSRSDPTPLFASTRELTPYVHVIERGRWSRRAAAEYAAMGIGCDFTARPIRSRFAEAIAGLRLAASRTRTHLRGR